MATKKVVNTEDVSRIALWDLPIFESTGSNVLVEIKPESVKMPTAEELSAVQDSAREEAYKEGLAQGQADGFEQGKQEGIQAGMIEGQAQGREQAYNEMKPELEAQVAQLRSLCETMTEPLKTMDEDVEQELVAVAMQVARHLVRRELKTDPGQVVAAVRQAVSILPINTRNIRVYLHPEDAILVKQSLSVTDEAEDEQRWKIVEDPALTRGGCNVETEHSRIDATVEARLSSIIAQALGGERDSDNG
ncbi:MAG: flagellar assembly protein FliH [Gammaproteobacteria bacterium]|nr:flagellar assembly protein FliH [Gammaproteobacteria bacterium]